MDLGGICPFHMQVAAQVSVQAGLNMNPTGSQRDNGKDTYNTWDVEAYMYIRIYV